MAGMDDDVLGPINYLAVEFPSGRMTGEGFDLLLDLVKRNVVRVLDLEFMAKSAEGIVRKVPLREVPHGSDVDVTMWEGASSGLVDQSDIDEIASAIGPGSLAGILVYENVWAAPLMAAMARTGALLLGLGPVEVDNLIAVLDQTEPTGPKT
jgi:hypothetical protein